MNKRTRKKRYAKMWIHGRLLREVRRLIEDALVIALRETFDQMPEPERKALVRHWTNKLSL